MNGCIVPLGGSHSRRPLLIDGDGAVLLMLLSKPIVGNNQISFDV